MLVISILLEETEAQLRDLPKWQSQGSHPAVMALDSGIIIVSL